MQANALDTTFAKICQKLKNFDKELNEKFTRLSTNFDRFRFIWSLGFVHSEVDALFEAGSGHQQRREFFDPKNSTKAYEFRRQGNEHYVAKRFDEALISYNQSIRYAPRVYDTEEASDNDLALSYGNRSAVFFSLDEYRLSLSDIERALKFGYPKHLRHKLIERKLNCLLRLEWFQEALSFLDSESDASIKNELRERIKEARKFIVIKYSFILILHLRN